MEGVNFFSEVLDFQPMVKHEKPDKTAA